MATTTEWKQQIQAGSWDAALSELYTPDQVPAQRARYLRTLEGFEQNFGADRDVRLYSAPGRTEIGGNHTDHNNGVVMAAAVDLDIIAVVAKNDRNTVRFISEGFGKIDEIDLDRAKVSRVAFPGSSVGVFQCEGATLGNVDIRGLEPHRISGVHSLSGATIDDTQLMLFAELFASELGITVE